MPALVVRGHLPVLFGELEILAPDAHLHALHGELEIVGYGLFSVALYGIEYRLVDQIFYISASEPEASPRLPIRTHSFVILNLIQVVFNNFFTALFIGVPNVNHLVKSPWA
jgi:hypothetical protein